MNYKRYFIPNSMVFITIVTYNRKQILSDYIDLIKSSLKYTKLVGCNFLHQNNFQILCFPFSNRLLFCNGFVSLTILFPKTYSLYGLNGWKCNYTPKPIYSLFTLNSRLLSNNSITFLCKKLHPTH